MTSGQARRALSVGYGFGDDARFYRRRDRASLSRRSITESSAGSSPRRTVRDAGAHTSRPPRCIASNSPASS
jgi:hypothetical protein